MFAVLEKMMESDVNLAISPRSLTAQSTSLGGHLLRHQATLLTLEDTAADQRFRMPCRKTYPFEGDFLNERHQNLVSRLHPSGMIDIGVEGWLLPSRIPSFELTFL